jgi:hypothetical protein
MRFGVPLLFGALVLVALLSPSGAPAATAPAAPEQVAPAVAADAGSNLTTDQVDPYLDMAPMAPGVKCDDLCRSTVTCSSSNLGVHCGNRINPQTGKTQKCYCATCGGVINCWH